MADSQSAGCCTSTNPPQMQDILPITGDVHTRNLAAQMMDDRALLGLGPQADGFAHQQALQYFEQLKNTCDGWHMCCTALASGTYEDNDHVKFFCLQVIEHYLKTRYASDSSPAPENVKAFLLASLQTQASSVVKDKPFLRNKLAQLFALAFRADYTHRWPSFFVDLLQSLGLSERVVDMYLHILMAIDSDVVDREIVHTLQETELNTMLKDAMRLQDVAQLVDSWYQIIVIGAYVSWIDINLIANERFVTVLLHFMTRPLLRESACDCIAEIISKGMEPLAKVKLIESFTSMLSGAGVFNVTEDDEYDFLVKLAKLVNIIGLQLVLCWQKQVKLGDAAGAKMSLVALEDKVVLLVKFLGNDDDDVSGMVAEFSHSYIGVLKQMVPLNCRQKETIKELLCVVIKKMKYDESYNFEREREDEAAFQEYRKELKVIFNNIGALDPDLVLLMVHEVISQTMQQWQTAKFYDVEVAISLLYNLGEAIPASHGQHFSGDPSKVSALQQMLRIMLDSQVSRYQHSAVTLQFFETIVRYDRFFNLEPQYIPNVLIAFLDERGLRSQSAHLCSRAAYLFSKFVKAINKPHLQNYLDDVLSRIQDLLILNSPGNGLKQYLNPDDQLFIYETASILIVQSQFPAEKKQELMKQMLAPIVSKFSDLLRSMSTEVDETKQLEYANCLSHAMAFASRASKGFSSQQTMKQCRCVEAYTETLGVFLHALNAPTQRQLMHAGVRQFLHRMVVCLGTEVLPFIPIAMESLLKNTDVRELHDFIPLINQVVSKFKKHIVPFLQEVFMPIVSAIFQVLSTPADERDQVAAVEKRMLQRGYFSFIATLVNNNVTEVLSNQDTANFQQVLLTLIQGAVDIPDPQGQKACFNILKRLVEVWANEKSPLAGFNEFMYKNIVPACFLAPMKPTFDLADAQTVLTLNECASCLKTIQDQRGDELTQFLLSTYLPTLNLSAELIQEFCQALKSDPKIFRNYLKQFFTRAKS